VIDLQDLSTRTGFSSSRSVEPLELKRVSWSELKPHIDVFEADGKARTGLLVGNNPVNWVDPYGLARGDWWDPRTYVPSPANPGGVTSVTGGYFKGLGGEGGIELVRLDECYCQYYIFAGLGAGFGGGGASGQGGQTMNVQQPSDYEGFFATISGGIKGFGGTMAVTPNFNSIPFIGSFFAPPDSYAASASAGPQTAAGFSTSLKNYWAVGDKFRCD